MHQDNPARQAKALFFFEDDFRESEQSVIHVLSELAWLNDGHASLWE
jgi:hypothetical protein